MRIAAATQRTPHSLVVPVHWRAGVKRAWSYTVYYVGYRLLSVHVSCGSLAVSGVPFVMKYGL